MAILFGLFGIILVVCGARGTISGTNPSLTGLLKDDFTGNDPYWKWLLAILFIGGIGYIPGIRPISRAFMVLVIIVFLIANQGFFAQIQSIFKPNVSGSQVS